MGRGRHIERGLFHGHLPLDAGFTAVGSAPSEREGGGDVDVNVYQASWKTTDFPDGGAATSAEHWHHLLLFVVAPLRGFEIHRSCSGGKIGCSDLRASRPCPFDADGGATRPSLKGILERDGA